MVCNFRRNFILEKINEKTINMINFKVPYFQSPNDIFDLKLDIKPNSKLVYLYLCRCGNNGADVFPSYNKIAEACGIGKRTAIDCVQELVKANLLYKESRKNEKGEATSNLYIVNTPENSTCVRLTKEQIKAKKKTRKKGSAGDAPLENNELGGAGDALGGAGDAPYKELLDKKTNINNYIISSSSKDTAPVPYHSLIDLFNDSICGLKKTTTVKFMKYVEKYDKEFIEAVIAYCEERNAKSYSYFEKAIESYISEGITTAEAMNESIESFNDKNRTRKNNAIKAKEEKKAEEVFDRAIDDRIMDELAMDIEPKEVEIVGEDIGESLKLCLRNTMSEVAFKTWIKPLEIRLNGDVVMVYCPNNFTRDIVDSRYRDILLQAMKLCNLCDKINVVVAL